MALCGISLFYKAEDCSWHCFVYGYLLCRYVYNIFVICLFLERREKDLDDVDHDAIAHRLRQDVVSVVMFLLGKKSVRFMIIMYMVVNGFIILSCSLNKLESFRKRLLIW